MHILSIILILPLLSSSSPLLFLESWDSDLLYAHENMAPDQLVQCMLQERLVRANGADNPSIL